VTGCGEEDVARGGRKDASLRAARPAIRGGARPRAFRPAPRPRPRATGLLCLLVLLGCGGGEGPAEDAFRVGLVFDVGGRGDKSFNDAAYAGLARARSELGIRFEFIEPGEGTDREAALRLFAGGPDQLVIGVGFLFSDDIRAVAMEYPEKSFACVDYTWSEGDTVPPNLLGIKFREEEGAYLVGAVAGLVTRTGVVGFVGGMDIPLIHKFEAGYRAGFSAVRPEGRVLVNYAGVTGDAFKNPAKGKELGLAQYDAGADIIFHASGSTGLGVIEAARERGTLVIGVDADQSEVAPDHILTSMIKKVDVAVFDAIRLAREGRFAGGILSLGLEEGGIDHVRKEQNERWLTPEVVARVEELRGAIVSGAIRAPVR
jgi:basic membrane protein A